MSAPSRIVTLDGPAGVGKTTIARAVAKALGVAYLDTGAMFRAVALKLGPEALEWSEERISRAVAGLEFGLQGTGEDTRLLCGGTPLGDEIRTEEIGMLASSLAKRNSVRERLKDLQCALGERYSLVTEGRDMGTVIFPKAPHKFFLDATPEIRALRRYRQLQEMGGEVDLQELTEQIRQRDEQDRTREIAPLRPADDAVSVDTSILTLEQVLQNVLDTISGNQ